MKADYHMHFEYGDYKFDWVEKFFDAAKLRGLAEIGITEHSHTFPEFENLYYDDLILDDSPVGKFQKVWLKTNKFKHTLKDYFDFMTELKKNHAVKIGIEVCNFRNQTAVKKILDDWNFDYIIGSVHFLNGWGYDASKIKSEWTRHDLREIYEIYTSEVERLAESKIYDVIGHPFNIRLFKNFPTFDVTKYLERVASAMKKYNLAVDVNTGTKYRYPVEEISPYADFMKVAAAYDLPIIISSDAHQPEDCGKFCDDAINYVKSFGYEKFLTFNQRQREFVKLG